MIEVKEIRISYIKNADIHNVPFQIPIVPCSQNPVDYQQLLNRNFTALESYRGYPIPLRTKIAYFLVFACKEKNYPRLNIQRAQFNSEVTNLPLPVDPMDVDTFTYEYTAQIERNLQLNEINTLFDGFYY